MKISFIVCTYSMENLYDTIECVNSLINQVYDNKEILLVMDKNDELYNKLLEYIPKSIKIIVNHKYGLSEARNTGIKNANGDIIVFIDDDAVVDKYYISHLIKNYSDKKVVGVGGKILPKGKPSYPEELYWLGGFTYKGYYEDRCEVRNVIGCNMSFRKNIFDKVGLFDTAFGRVGRKLVTAEETEFSIRTLHLLNGSKIIYDPSVVVYHKVYRYRQTLRYIMNRAYCEGKSKANIEILYKNKNGNKGTLSTENTYLKYLFVNTLPMRIKNIFTGNDVIFNIRCVMSLFLVITSVFLGYMIGKARLP